MKNILILSLVLAAGCFTVSETECPRVRFDASAAPAVTNISVNIVGFSVTVTSYVGVQGHEMYYQTGPFGGYCGGSWTSGTTTMLVPRERQSLAYILQARDRIESAGFIVGMSSGDYVVEANFGEPVEKGSTGLSALWTVLSLFTYSSSEYAWTAKLRIRDNRTGRLVFNRDYVQEHYISIFSPLPVFGISACEKTGFNYAQDWCLTALTDTMTADAIEYLRGVR